MTLKCIVRK